MHASTAGPGGGKGTKEAERTDDLIAIIRMQLQELPEGPKMICGDVNAKVEDLPTLHDMIRKEGWTDAGNDGRMCKGNPGQPTCHANATAKESRIDLFVTNEYLTPAVTSFHIDHSAKYPTHKPIRLRIATSKLTTVTNQLRKPTNFATLFQEKLDADTRLKQ